MSKIILFSNIKGGVGKTTLCAHFAEYLSMKGVPVVAVDADIQASLSRHREREVEADPGQTVPWAITRLNTLDSKIVKAAMNEYKEQDGIVLTDCPGNLNDNNLSISLFPSSARSHLPAWFSCPTASTPQKARHMSVK